MANEQEEVEEDHGDAFANRSGFQSVQEDEEHAIFTIHNRPVRFYLYTNGKSGHYSLTPHQVEILSNKIYTHGGNLTLDEEDADTIIAPYAAIEDLRGKFWDSRTVYVEEPSFVQRCIIRKRYVENRHKPVRKGMGGRSYGGNSRVEFTAEDDRHLCEYIASVAPNPDEGGRSGLEIYKRLLRSAEYFEHRRWAKRHTYWSWLERYRKRRALFDPIIEHLVEENPPPADGKGLYERSRLVKSGTVRQELVEDEDEADAEEEEEEEGSQRVREGGETRKRPRVDSSGESDGEREEEEYLPVHPAKRVRRSDMGPRVVSPIEHGRLARRPTSFPQSTQRWDNSLLSSDDDDEEPTGIPFETLSENPASYEVSRASQSIPSSIRRPGPEDAGPSGTQPSPSHLRSPMFEFSPHSLSDAARRVPMSSQATLVGTQMAPADSDKVFAARQTVSETNQSVRSKTILNSTAARPASGSARRRGNMQAQTAAISTTSPQTATRTKKFMVVEPPPVSDSFPKPRTRATVSAVTGARTRASTSRAPRPNTATTSISAIRQQNMVEEVHQDSIGDSAMPSYMGGNGSLEGAPGMVGETNEDELEDVEGLLAISNGSNSQSKASNPMSGQTSRQPHPFEVDMDSDDERSRSILLPAVISNTSATSGVRSGALIRSAVNTPERRQSAVQPPGTQRVSFTPASLLVERSQASSRRRSGPRLTGSSDTDSVPMQGTRAREEKVRMVEELQRTPYTPPRGTRAAAATLTLRNREVPRIGVRQ
ncbi:uncharacterized protein FIBRA_06725 [Fibroporia radiculosa]|uniref:Rap1 Myb domain-containing protein n=1 Tax=Fibroporia radiculosa TaxID=599839 RepID=J4H483_9APHY|nr:uncharacterized protein FIBRA_06725 [Fibroporia radiculosa]CCM04544.1 predicted protein [Fibroporia radiculosa]